MGLGRIRATSHYCRRSRGCGFPPITLQETKSSASRPFTLEAKVHRPWLSQVLTWQHFLTKATNSRGEFGSRQNRNPNHGREAVGFFSLKNRKVTRSRPLDWRGYFGPDKKYDNGLWTWPLEASHYDGPSREAVKVHGHKVWTWAWPLEASHCVQPKPPISIFY